MVTAITETEDLRTFRFDATSANVTSANATSVDRSRRPKSKTEEINFDPTSVNGKESNYVCSNANLELIF